ncbi:MAG: hypothetical protein IIB74_03980 [Proteobacteria bacterium]|nr:hypothetical protein [Pseudomonadota bacterium]MCH8159439.1 hypothetical protein [Pseudomonadota bacterium]
MKIGKAIGSIANVALVGGLIYGIVNWQEIIPQEDDVKDFAEKACVDEIERRYDVSTVRIYSFNETNNGYVVRVTVTLTKGNAARVYCLTNSHGGVKEITIEER